MKMEVKAQIKQLMKDAVALYVNKPNALLFGEKTYIDEDKILVPYQKGNSIMVPVHFFAKTVGCEENVFTLLKEAGIKAEKRAEAEKCRIAGAVAEAEMEADTKVEVKAGERLYAPIAELCRICGWYLHTEKNGIVIYSRRDMEDVLDWRTNMKTMRRISESYVFGDLDGKLLCEMLKGKHPDCKHPRMIITPEKLQQMRKDIAQGEPVYQKLFQDLQGYADKFLKERTSGYEIRDGIRLGYVCQENSERMLTCALMYLLTEEEKYAQRAYLEMYASACFVDWNPYHFLDVGEMAMAVGLCYDWLYHWMSPWQRKLIREAIVQNAIYPIMEDFEDKPRRRSWNWRGDLADNWRLVILSVGTAALAIADELEGKELAMAQRVMEQTMWDIRESLSLFAPLGAYEEGYSYWEFGMIYFVYHISAMMTAVGTDFGYVDVPGMKLTNQYLMAMNGPVKVFNYHDFDDRRAGIPPQMMFLAEYFGQYSEALPRIEKILSTCPPARMLVSDMLYYNPAFLKANSLDKPLDCCLPVSEVATMRTGWEKTATYVGLHCDDPIGGEGHDHMDAGTFVLDAQGENFILDLGADSYVIPNYLHAYRVRAEGHNTVIFNPEADYAQKYGGTAQIVEHAFTDKTAYAVGELTHAYDEKHGVKSFYRKVQLDRELAQVMVQDTIQLTKQADFWWFTHTRADVEVLEGGKQAVLTQNGKKLLASIESGKEAFFTVMPAKPLPTSPVIEEQNPNEGVCKLTIHILKCEGIDLRVTFKNI